jgi:hypothetical protein
MGAAQARGTPVLASVSQALERLGQLGYRRRSPTGLAADADPAALADTGADPGWHPGLPSGLLLG